MDVSETLVQIKQKKKSCREASQKRESQQVSLIFRDTNLPLFGNQEVLSIVFPAQGLQTTGRREKCAVRGRWWSSESQSRPAFSIVCVVN